MSTIKEKLISIIKKIVVIILACLMLIGVLPIGLMPTDTTEKFGNFIKVFAQEEKYFNEKDDAETSRIGRGHSGYIMFSLSELTEKDIEEIKNVKLRLAFLKGRGSLSNKAIIEALPYERLPEKKKSEYFKLVPQRKISVIYPETMGEEDSLSEIDITEYVKECLDKEKYEIIFRLSSNAEIPMSMATGRHTDSAYRPCIKVVTGEAEDTDAHTLKKARLTEAVYVSSALPNQKGSGKEDNIIVSGEGNEAYMKFDLSDSAIMDSVCKARLSLCRKESGEATALRAYVVNNDGWSAENISYNSRPRGAESAPVEFYALESGRCVVDITQAVCEAYSAGMKSITVRIVAQDKKISFYGMEDTKYKPHLYITTSDDKNIESACEAALTALGINSAGFVTMDLINNYTSVDETVAKIKWKEYDRAGKNITGRHILENGRIVRPRWFEEDAEVIAVAKIQSGDYSTFRKYHISIPAETAPDYEKYEFGNYINIGNSKSEEEQKLESVRVSATKRRWTSGRMFNYRTLSVDGAMVLNFACVGSEDNYITLKLWEGDDTNFGDFRLTMCDDEEKSIILKAPEAESANGGFVYATYALPREFTKGRRYISLRLSGISNQGTDRESRGVYSAYLTQSPDFDPQNFERQGENVISETSFGEGAIGKFIDNLKRLSAYVGIHNGIDGESLDLIQNSGTIAYDCQRCTAVVASDDLNIAFSVDEEKKSATVYQRSNYYDLYCADCPIIQSGGMTIADWGKFKMIWNCSDEKSVLLKDLPIELSGTYKDIIGNKYYYFADDGQMADDSVIPVGETLFDGQNISVLPNSAIMLMQMAEIMRSSDWRISEINGENAADITFDDNMLEEITVKSVGEIADNVERIKIIIVSYENGKVVSVFETSEEVFDSKETYVIDLKEAEIYMKKGREIKIFVEDSTNLINLQPKIELT